MNKRPDYQISTRLNEDILEIVITGKGTPRTTDAVRKDIIDAIRATRPQALLCDTRAYVAPREIAEAYFRARSLPGNVRILPSAIIDCQADPEYISFYETTAANAGISMKWFSDVESARIWLKTILDKRKK